jgi:GNAT superfamily N-acetyltransferase
VIRLPAHDLGRVRHLFGAAHLCLVIDAIIAGTSPARVWADDLTAPCTALAWDGGHCVYLAGAAGQGEQCQEVFSREIAPAGRGMFKLYAAEEAVRTVFAGYALQQRERVFYRGGEPPLTRCSQPLPAGFAISSINDRFAGLSALGNFAAVAAEIGSCWDSVTSFRQAGFGFCAHDAQTIVCWCTAEYVSSGKCGIGIETVPSHQGRGFATWTAAAFVAYCARRSITPHWDAWSSNLPSVAVAEKTGFRKTGTYPVFVGTFPGT